MVSGIFRVIRHSKIDAVTVGTAFAIDVICPHGTYYLLTAYHVIEEQAVRGWAITVCDENGAEYAASLVYSGCRACTEDFALLSIQSEKKYETYFPTPASRIQECYVRGTSPSFKTCFLTLDAKSYGIEVHQEGGEILTVELSTKHSFDQESKIVSDQVILGGFSGSPVYLEDQKNANSPKCCIGVLGNLHPEMSVSSRQFCVPMQTIIATCLQPIGIYDEYRVENSFEQKKDYELTLGLLFGEIDISDFTLTNNSMETRLWNTISNQFYRGKAIDRFLQELFDRGLLSSYSIEVQIALKYCQSRLLFKENRKNEAFRYLGEIKKQLGNISPQASRKMAALVGARCVIEEDIKNISATLTNVRNATSLFERLDATDSYIANEIASVYGRCLTNIFALSTKIESAEKSEIIKMCDEHTRLLNTFPVELCKQDVVNTSLNWFVGFWKLEDRDEDMHSVIEQGFRQSHIRKNAIFYIQCLLAYSIYFLENHRDSMGIFFGLLAIKLMKQKKIRMDHEGVKQLFFFLKQFRIDCYFAFEKYFKFGSIAEHEEFVERELHLCNLHISKSEFIEQLSRADYVFENIYQISLNTNPYDIPISNLSPYFS